MNEKDYKALLNKVRNKLKKAHIPAVAEETGLYDNTIRRIANSGGRPLKSNIVILAKYFGIGQGD